jgi:hypothetical protein
MMSAGCLALLLFPAAWALPKKALRGAAASVPDGNRSYDNVSTDALIPSRHGNRSAENLTVDHKLGISLSWDPHSRGNSSAEKFTMDDKLGQSDAWDQYKRGHNTTDNLTADHKLGISLSWDPHSGGYGKAEKFTMDDKLGQSDAWDQYKRDNSSVEKLAMYNKLGQANASDLGSVEMLRLLDPNYQPASEKVPDATMLIGMAVETANFAEADTQMDYVSQGDLFQNRLKHFHGPTAMIDMAQYLHAQLGTNVTASPDQIFRCAQDPGCLSVWGTDVRLLGTKLIIRDVLASWNMREGGNRCHFKSQLQDAWCHQPDDIMGSAGRAYMALAVPALQPDQPALPMAYVCHSGMNARLICHTMSGYDFILPPVGLLHN